VYKVDQYFPRFVVVMWFNCILLYTTVHGVRTIVEGIPCCKCDHILYMYFMVYSIISYNLLSFRGSAQDYKIHMDMEIVKFT